MGKRRRDRVQSQQDSIGLHTMVTMEIITELFSEEGDRLREERSKPTGGRGGVTQIKCRNPVIQTLGP